MKQLTRLDRLMIMRSSIEDCMHENPDMEWGDMLQRADDMVRKEQHRLGHHAVYPIVDGCSREAVYESTLDNCRIYVGIAVEHDPSKKDQFIILPI